MVGRANVVMVKSKCNFCNLFVLRIFKEAVIMLVGYTLNYYKGHYSQTFNINMYCKSGYKPIFIIIDGLTLFSR